MIINSWALFCFQLAFKISVRLITWIKSITYLAYFNFFNALKKKIRAKNMNYEKFLFENIRQKFGYAVVE